MTMSATTMLQLDDIEQALDNGRLWVAVKGAKTGWWLARRNGMTKLWKRSPNRFRIPLKAGFRLTGAITEADINLDWWEIRP